MEHIHCQQDDLFKKERKEKIWKKGFWEKLYIRKYTSSLVSLEPSHDCISVIKNSLALQYFSTKLLCSTLALSETHVTTENMKTLIRYKRQGNFFLVNSYEPNIGYLSMRFMRSSRYSNYLKCRLKLLFAGNLPRVEHSCGSSVIQGRIMPSATSSRMV